MFCLFLNPILSEGFLPEIHGESANRGRARRWVSPVSPQLYTDLTGVFSGVRVCVGMQYLHSAVMLPPLEPVWSAMFLVVGGG